VLLPGRIRRVSLALLFIVAATGVEFAQAQSFEQLIEELLRRRGVEETPAPEPVEPFPGAPPVISPPPAGQPPLVPVEPGPRPYTPPKIDRPAEESPPPQPTTSAPAPTTATPAPSPTPAPAPTTTLAPAATPAPPAPAPAGATAPAPDTTALPGVVPPPVTPGVKRTLESLTVEEANAATFAQSTIDNPDAGASPFVLKLQVLLDRVGASPGVIDSFHGGNVSKAVAAVQTALGQAADGTLTEAIWTALGGDDAAPVLVRYAITAEDAAYPFVASIPPDYVEQSRLPSLGYQGPVEMFGERFHMDAKLLRALNPTVDFTKTGSEIWVTDVAGAPITEKVARIEADKTSGQVRAYDAANHLIVAYAATVGSEANPSPLGDHVVSAVIPNPAYDFAIDAGLGHIAGTIQPGPNNPLGTVHILLTEPGYSIQGTPEPSRIGKPAPDGTVRLTNWDAEELAGLVAPGVVVSFVP
jgi:lipoprotein-anchoring transpeptidase ErfK/SrfK